MVMNVVYRSNSDPTKYLLSRLFQLISFCSFIMSILCVGPRNSGKTMLLNSIQYPNSVNFTTHSVNTVGTNIYTIHYNLEKPLKKSAKKNITIRELGGEMAVMWKNYYTESVEKIMFVVDTSNLCQISCAGKIFCTLFFVCLIKTFLFFSCVTQTFTLRGFAVFYSCRTKTAKSQNLSDSNKDGLRLSTNEKRGSFDASNRETEEASSTRNLDN